MLTERAGRRLSECDRSREEGGLEQEMNPPATEPRAATRYTSRAVGFLLMRVLTRVIFGSVMWIGICRIVAGHDLLPVTLSLVVVGLVGFRRGVAVLGRPRSAGPRFAAVHAGLPAIERGLSLLGYIGARLLLPFIEWFDMGWLSTPVLYRIEFVILVFVGLLGTGLVVFGTRIVLGLVRQETLRACGIDIGAEELLRLDSRPPIVYLRPFEQEAKRATVRGLMGEHRKNFRSRQRVWLSRSPPREILRDAFRHFLYEGRRGVLDGHLHLAAVLRQCGPYIAIGRPTEGFVDAELGSTKLFVSDREWRGVILDWLRRAGGVVLESGSGKGIAWEVEQVINKVDPRRVLLLVPLDQEEYAQFLIMSGRLFPASLPITVPPAGMLLFDREWSPRHVEEGVFLEDRLAGYLELLQPATYRWT